MPRSVALALAVVALSPRAAPATTARLAPLAGLASRADLVVVGRAVARASFWDGGRILTRVTVETEEVWGGAHPPGRSVEIVTLGGVIGDFAQVVHGSPTIARGERLALFLARHPAHGFVPLSLWQGVFRVHGDGPDAPVSRPLPPVRIVGESSQPLPGTLAALRRSVVEARSATR